MRFRDINVAFNRWMSQHQFATLAQNLRSVVSHCDIFIEMFSYFEFLIFISIQMFFFSSWSKCVKIHWIFFHQFKNISRLFFSYRWHRDRLSLICKKTKMNSQQRMIQQWKKFLRYWYIHHHRLLRTTLQTSSITWYILYEKRNKRMKENESTKTF